MPNYKSKSSSKAASKSAPKKKTMASSSVRTTRSKTAKVSAPVAKQLTMTKSQMSSTRYAETERVSKTAIKSTGSDAASYPQFSLQTAITGTAGAINPGIASMFPWLSKHANLYEKYRFKKLVYRYKTVSPTTSAGQVLMAYDMDPSDGSPADVAAMSQSAKYADGPVWQKLSLSIPCDQEWRYVNSTANVPTGRDARLTHLGNFWMAVQDCADNASKGYLEVEYVVEFKGKSTDEGALSPSRNVAQFLNLSSETASADIRWPLSATVFGTPDAAGGITLSPGRYLFTVMGVNGLPASGVFTIRDATNNIQIISGPASTVAPPLPVHAVVTLTAATRVTARLTTAIAVAQTVSMIIELL